MITHLRLSQFILIEKADISFTSGFNVLTGETGSGKSALLEAIALLLGARTDTAFIRHGEERAEIEAVFALGSLPAPLSLLQDANILSSKEQQL
jgi:DNA repair protein RecN (Recombination protein N)